MRRILVAASCLAVLAVAVCSAGAQSVRTEGMGQVMLTTGTDAAAWWHNVALVPLIPLAQSGREWGGAGQVTRAVSGGSDWTTVDFTMRSADGVQGLGAGFRGGDGWSDIGVGYARTLRTGLTGGVSVGYRAGDETRWDAVDDFWCTAAVAYDPEIRGEVVVRVGLEYWNMVDGGQGQWNIGVGGIWPNGLSIGIDGVDITNDGRVDLGAEYAHASGFKLRAGLIGIDEDATLTLGAAYARGPFEVGVAWQNWSEDDYVALGVTGGW